MAQRRMGPAISTGSSGGSQAAGGGGQGQHSRGGGGHHAAGGQQAVGGQQGGHYGRGGPQAGQQQQRGSYPAPVVRGAPQLGFGNVNHPGLGYAPNSIPPNLGMPGMQPLPLGVQPGVGPTIHIGPIRPGAVRGAHVYPYRHPGHGHVHAAGCGHTGYSSYGYGVSAYGYGGSAGVGGYYGSYYSGPIVVGVPVPVQGSYIYTTNGYQYVGEVPGQAPAVIVIQPQAQGDTQSTQGLVSRPEGSPAPIYETRAPQAEQPTPPPVLLVFKDRTIYAVQKYWKQDDRLFFVTSSGNEQSVPFETLDLDFTRRINEERHVRFEF